MNVIRMALTVLVISYLVFPKTPLPDIPFPLHDFALARGALKQILVCPRKCALDQHPPI